MGIPTAGSYDLHRRTNRYHTNPRDAGPAGSFEEGVGEDGGYGDFGIVARDGNVHVGEAVVILAGLIERGEGLWIAGEGAVGGLGDAVPDGFQGAIQPDGEAVVDRKSTRLNSSHLGISHGVFCLKQKIAIVVPSFATGAAWTGRSSRSTRETS